MKNVSHHPVMGVHRDVGEVKECGLGVSFTNLIFPGSTTVMHFQEVGLTKMFRSIKIGLDVVIVRSACNLSLVKIWCCWK